MIVISQGQFTYMAECEGVMCVRWRIKTRVDVIKAAGRYATLSCAQELKVKRLRIYVSEVEQSSNLHIIRTHFPSGWGQSIMFTYIQAPPKYIPHIQVTGLSVSSSQAVSQKSTIPEYTYLYCLFYLFYFIFLICSLHVKLLRHGLQWPHKATFMFTSSETGF